MATLRVCLLVFGFLCLSLYLIRLHLMSGEFSWTVPGNVWERVSFLLR